MKLYKMQGDVKMLTRNNILNAYILGIATAAETENNLRTFCKLTVKDANDLVETIIFGKAKSAMSPKEIRTRVVSLFNSMKDRLTYDELCKSLVNELHSYKWNAAMVRDIQLIAYQYKVLNNPKTDVLLHRYISSLNLDKYTITEKVKN